MRAPATPIRRPAVGGPAVPAAIVLGVVITLAFVWTMLVGNYAQFAAFMIVAALVAITVPIARHAARVEAWPALSGLVMAAMLLRLGGALARYEVAYGAYGGVADASTYTNVAQSHYHAFRALHLFAPDTSVFHGLIPWLDTVVYALFGPTEIGSFFLFSWLNFLGAYLFYRAFRIAYPGGDGKRYAVLVFFLPSLVYWPSSLGKEGWMMLAIGLSCYGLARALASRPGGYLAIAAGVAGMILVRPHLALILLPAAIVAFLFRRSQPGRSRPIGRLVGLAVLIVASLIVVGKAQSYFGIKSLDVQTITQQLQTTRQQTALGNSAFRPPNAQSPLGYPEAVVTVLFRPFPFEAHGTTVLVASLEGLLLLGLTAVSWRRLKRLPRALWESPYMIFCLIYCALFVLAFANFSNFGILARERVQMLPMFLALLAIPVSAQTPAPTAAAERAEPRRGGRSALPQRRLAAYPRSRPANRARPATARAVAMDVGDYRALGHRFDVSIEHPGAGQQAAAIRWALADLADPVQPEHHYRLTGGFANRPYLVEVDARRLGAHGSLSEALEALVADVNQQAVLSRPDGLALHSAAVSWQGRGIVVLGPSGVGKSTLAAALVMAGCDYLTDEAALVDLETRSITPYPKPVSLRPDSLPLLGLQPPSQLEPVAAVLVPASYLRPSVAVGAVPVSTFIVPTRGSGRGVSITPISRAQGFIEVANNSFNFVHHGSEWLEPMRRLLMASSVWRLECGDVHSAARAVIRVAETSNREHQQA